MNKKVSPVPKGYRTATPCLVVTDINSAIEFYSNAFEASTLTLTNDPTNTIPVHAAIKVGNSIIVLQAENPEAGVFAPVTLGSRGSQTHLYLEEVDGFWTTALAGGAIAVVEPVDAYWGDRTATLVDPFGHCWTIASRIEHVSREEVQKRSAAIFLPEVLTESAMGFEMPAELELEGEFSQEIAA
jgi:PhnB protein